MKPPAPSRSALAPPLRVFAAMLAGMSVIPAVRPLLAARGASESSMHLFMSINMVGAALATPLVALAADKSGRRRDWLAALALADAALLVGCAARLPLYLVMTLRALQGAANVGALTLAMTDDDGRDDAREIARARAFRGFAMMAAIVVGPMLGGALLAFGPEGPFGGAAIAAGLVSLFALGSPSAERATRSHTRPTSLRGTIASAPLLVVPAAIAFAERFTVGCFVVTFALRAHGVLHMTDRQVSLGYSLFLVPFALGMVPASLLARRVPREAQLACGAALYAVAFTAFGLTSGDGLAAALVTAGIASALMYAPALSYASSLSPEGAPSMGMALFHTAGCVGMMSGPAAAGILSATLRASGASDETRYAAVFALGAGVLAAIVVALRPRLRAISTRSAAPTPRAPAPAWVLHEASASFSSRPPRRA